MGPSQSETTSSQSGSARNKNVLGLNERQLVQTTPTGTPIDQGSAMSSSPPPLAGSSQSQADSFRSMVGGKREREQLSGMMGVDHSNKSRKIFLRGKIREEVRRFLDMSKPFSSYDYTSEIYPVIKHCTRYVNKEFLTGEVKWSRETMHHVIKAIFTDTRRNEAAKAKAAEKRKSKRLLAVSFETSMSTQNWIFCCLHVCYYTVDAACQWICCKQPSTWTL